MLEKHIEVYLVRRVKELGGMAYKFTVRKVPDGLRCWRVA